MSRTEGLAIIEAGVIKECPSFSRDRWRREARRLLDALGPAARVLNIGSKNARIAPHVINLDIAAGPNVDIVGDAHRLPFPDGSLDAVIITAVLEIVGNPPQVAAEIRRVLKDGGVVLATLPFLQPYHPDPTDCHRFTCEGVLRLFAGFETVQLTHNKGPVSMFLWVARDFLSVLFSWNNLTLWKAFYVTLSWVLFPLSILDRLLPEHPRLHFIASSFLYVGKKRGGADA